MSTEWKYIIYRGEKYYGVKTLKYLQDIASRRILSPYDQVYCNQWKSWIKAAQAEDLKPIFIKLTENGHESPVSLNDTMPLPIIRAGLVPKCHEGIGGPDNTSAKIEKLLKMDVFSGFKRAKSAFSSDEKVSGECVRKGSVDDVARPQDIARKINSLLNIDVLERVTKIKNVPIQEKNNSPLRHSTSRVSITLDIVQPDEKTAAVGQGISGDPNASTTTFRHLRSQDLAAIRRKTSFWSGVPENSPVMNLRNILLAFLLIAFIQFGITWFSSHDDKNEAPLTVTHIEVDQPSGDNEDSALH